MLARSRFGFLILAIAILLPPFASAAAADWPMWRGNAGRTASTDAALPAQLAPAWVRQLPPPRPAWPESQTKLQFDRSYEPVVAGERLIVGSTVNDSVTAYSTKTGDELWRFYTDGPVRFAPVIDGTEVYAVSDDGHLYCLDLADGDLVWKFNGGPANRAIIGNHRLISSWPVRGGVVVADGVAYFSASIWPSMGIFIHAIDVKTGKAIWTNSDTGSAYTVHPHGASAFGSVVPQGYFAIGGDSLIVPGGRSLPAILSRKTGKVTYFDFGGKSSGGYDVMANDQVFVCRNDIGKLGDGKVFAQVNASVLDGDMLVGSSGSDGSLQLQSWAGKFEETKFKDRKGQTQKRTEFTPTKKHTIATTAGGPLQVQVKAGNVVYASAGSQVMAFPLDYAKPPTEPLKPSWSAKVDGKIWRIIAADNRLFVVTEEGSITCFSENPNPLVTHALQAEPLTLEQDRWSPWLETLKVKLTDEGYCIVLGVGDAGLIKSLLLRSKLQLVVVDPNADHIGDLRREMDRHGLYGTRIAAHVGDIRTFAFPPYMANLIVSEELGLAGYEPTVEFVNKLFYPLRPYGGVAALPIEENDSGAYEKAVALANPPGATIGPAGPLYVLTRAGALPGSGSWTHQYGNAANTVVSQDQLVKAPLGLLWFGGPSNDKVLPRHGHGPSPQVAGGRLVIEGPDMLRAVDVYTGRVLWEKELKGVGKYYDITSHAPGAGEIGSNYITLADRVYAVYGSEIVELNAGTGEHTKSFKLPAAADKKNSFWGFAAADGDLLAATSSPVAVETKEEKPAPKKIVSTNAKTLIPQKSEWQYLAGSDPPDNWTSPEFAAKGWSTGKAGFGYGHQGNETIFREMRGNFQRIYIRKTFDSKDVGDEKQLTLMNDFDDGFIAYLNGTEIARANVKVGRGAKTEAKEKHDAGSVEAFDIKDFRKLLHDGQNVIAIEGHNKGIGSSDFVLDPYVTFGGDPKPAADAKTDDKPPAPITSALTEVQYSSASRRIVVFDRHSGKQLWTRDAAYSFRHNCIVLSGDTLYCIDGMTPAKLQALGRRGVKPTAKAKLLALNARTGDEKWSTDKDVFGTFLNYSAQHDVLLQAGSAYRDRAKDEASKGMIAYRGADGKVLWKDLELSHGGPCLLWRDKIITNGLGGFQLDLMTGKRTGWTYSRMYGCNTAIGSDNLLTFRSGAAGFCDLASDSGTGNIGGFRSSCTANLIAADGVLNAPDYTRTCICSYQNQTSLALVYMPEAESWTFNSQRDLAAGPLKLGVNLGAPGDRRSADGTLWLEYPSIGGPSPALKIEVTPASPQWFHQHSSAISGDGPAWVAASGARGIDAITLTLPELAKPPAAYTVRLHFSEPDDVKPGDRVFSVAVQGDVLLKDFDIIQAAGGRNRALVRELTGIKADRKLEVKLSPKESTSKHRPILCGIEILGEQQSR